MSYKVQILHAGLSLAAFLSAAPFAVANPRSCAAIFSSDATILKDRFGTLHQKTGTEVLSEALPTPLHAQVTELGGRSYAAEMTAVSSGGMRSELEIIIDPKDGRMSMNMDLSYSVPDGDASVVEGLQPIFDGEGASLFKAFESEPIASYARVDVVPKNPRNGDKAQVFLLGYDIKGGLRVIYVLQAEKMPFGGGLSLTDQPKSFRRIEIK